MALPDYILFIDTETSGMPRKWTVSTSKTHKWPYILQIAWLIYTWKGEKIQSRNFYINTGKIEIEKEAQNLHGITHELLEARGIKRKKVMRLLSKDIEKYQPLIVGHFLEFDKRMMEVGFTRAKVKQNFALLPKFCTMVFSKKLRTASFTPKFMRLNELHQFLFGSELSVQHNAFSDALATKDCFFELRDRGMLNENEIEHQQQYFKQYSLIQQRTIQVIFVFLFLILLTLLLLYWFQS
jgi:DNA polymerase III subunit epsilon